MVSCVWGCGVSLRSVLATWVRGGLREAVKLKLRTECSDDAKQTRKHKLWGGERSYLGQKTDEEIDIVPMHLAHFFSLLDFCCALSISRIQGDTSESLVYRTILSASVCY